MDVFFHDLVLEFLEGMSLVVLVGFVKGSIVMQPLVMGHGVEFLQQSSRPLAGFLVGVALTIVLDLNCAPLFGRKSEKEVVPPN
jgi:hypothetical protein